MLDAYGPHHYEVIRTLSSLKDTDSLLFIEYWHS
jgi:hypothetical protein